MSVSDDRKRMPAVPPQFKPDGGPLTGPFQKSVDPVGAVNERAAEREREELLKAQAGPDALAGGNSAMADRVRTLLGLDEVDARKEEDVKLQMQLVAVNAYLERVRERILELDEEIHDLKEDIAEKQKASDAAYADIEDLEELKGSLKDGVSDAERAKLVKIFGKKAENADADDLENWISALQKEKLEEAIELDKQIEKDKEKVEDLERERDEWEHDLDALEMNKSAFDRGEITREDYIRRSDAIIEPDISNINEDKPVAVENNLTKDLDLGF